MIYKPLNNAFLKSGTYTARNKVNPEHMEGIGHMKLSKEMNPAGGRVAHGAVRVEGELAAFSLQRGQQRDQCRRNRHGERLVPFRFWKVNFFPVKVHVTHRQPRFVKSAARPVCNSKHGAHPRRRLRKRVHNPRQVLRVYLWLFLLFVAGNAQAFERVSAGVSDGDRVTHQHAQGTEFVQSGVLAGLSNASLAFLKARSPDDVLPGMLAGQFGGIENLPAGKERFESAPTVRVAFQIGRLFSVSQRQPRRDPNHETLTVEFWAALVGVRLPQSVPSLARLRWIIPTQARGLGRLPAGLPITDIPERRLGTLKEPSHGVTVGYTGGVLACATDSKTLSIRAMLFRGVPLEDSTRVTPFERFLREIGRVTVLVYS